MSMFDTDSHTSRNLDETLSSNDDKRRSFVILGLQGKYEEEEASNNDEGNNSQPSNQRKVRPTSHFITSCQASDPFETIERLFVEEGIRKTENRKTGIYREKREKKDDDYISFRTLEKKHGLIGKKLIRSYTADTDFQPEVVRILTDGTMKRPRPKKLEVKTLNKRCEITQLKSHKRSHEEMSCDQIFNVLKRGIQKFIENDLKRQHNELLKSVSTENATDERTRSCSECTKDNLLPLHPRYNCPSQKRCLCMKKTRDRRHCPNKVCDKVFERIIRLHITCSPNLKNTRVDRWSEDYMEIAKCFMKHNSDSIAECDLMDLLHIMANDKLLRRELGLEGNYDMDLETDFLNEVIQFCKKVRRQPIIDNEQHVEKYYEHLIKLLKAVGDENAKKAIKQLEKKNYQASEGICSSESEAKTEDKKTIEDFLKTLDGLFASHVNRSNDVFLKGDNGIKLEFIQALNILDYPEKVIDINNIPEYLLRKTSMMHGLINETCDNNTCFAFYHSNDEKNWFISNILRWKFQCNKDNDSIIILVLSQQFAKILNLTVEKLCEMVSNVLTLDKCCLVVFDTSDKYIQSNLGLFYAKKRYHLFVRLISMSNLLEQREQGSKYFILGGIKELVINAGEGKCRAKTPGGLKRCLHRCFRKIRSKSLENLTFKNWHFDGQVAKIKIELRERLKTIRLNDSKLVPVADFEQLELENVSFNTSEITTLCENVRGIQSLVISGQKKFILENLKSLPLFMYNCPRLKMIETAKFTIGHEDFIFRLNKNMIDESCLCYLKKTSSLCKINEIACMVHHMINRQLLRKFKRDDYDKSNWTVEKQFIMDAICYSLLQEHDMYVNVYPARYEGYGEINLVCITKERIFDILLQNSETMNNRAYYAGFERVEKSAYSFSTANSSCSEEAFVDMVNKYYAHHFDAINKVIEFHAEKLLNKHKNLVSVSVSLGKTNDNQVDVELDPHVVIYVTAKSYIPLSEGRFPKQLNFEDNINTVYPVDVREGYYISMADSQSIKQANVKLSNLAMGCSIGAQNGKMGGTMGPFVEFKETETRKMRLGFLTACHLFKKPTESERALNTIVVQPSDIDEPFGTKTHGKECGQIVACKFNEYVDAALIRIDNRHPSIASFITPSTDALDDAGFDTFPKYQQGRSIPVSDLNVKSGNADRRLVKFGKTTGLRRGHLLLTKTVVRRTDQTLHGHCPSSLPLKVAYRHELKQQMSVLSYPESSFFQKGDSGCGVFLADNNNDLWCIGLGIGMLSDSMTILTPIHKILEELRLCDDVEEIRLKSFEKEEMETD